MRQSSLVSALLGVVFVAAVAPASAFTLPSLRLDGMSEEAVGQLKNTIRQSGSWSVRIANKLFSPVVDTDSGADLDRDNYLVAMGQELPPHLAEHQVGEQSGYHLLHIDDHDEMTALLEVGPPTPKRAHFCREAFFGVKRLEKFEAAVEQIKIDWKAPKDPKIDSLVQKVDKNRILGTVERISSLTGPTGNEPPSRNVFSPGIHVAGQYIEQVFKQLGYTPQLDDFSRGVKQSNKRVDSVNIIAELKGVKHPEEFVVVGAHYDSVPDFNGQDAAPGAEDNGSGVASLLELACLLSKAKTERTIKFVAFSGEEHGLLGSDEYAKKIVDEGKRDKYKGAIIMDMVSFSKDGKNTALLETNEKSKPLMDLIGKNARYADSGQSMELFMSLHPFGSDHVSFLDRSMSAVLTIDKDWHEYKDYHKSTDLPKNLVPSLGERITKMNLASLAEIAGLVEVAPGAADCPVPNAGGKAAAGASGPAAPATAPPPSSASFGSMGMSGSPGMAKGSSGASLYDSGASNYPSSPSNEMAGASLPSPSRGADEGGLSYSTAPVTPQYQQPQQQPQQQETDQRPMMGSATFRRREGPVQELMNLPVGVTADEVKRDTQEIVKVEQQIPQLAADMRGSTWQATTARQPPVIVPPSQQRPGPPSH